MGWLSRIFKGSEQKISEGHYSKEDAGYYLPSTSGVTTNVSILIDECFGSYCFVLLTGMRVCLDCRMFGTRRRMRI